MRKVLFFALAWLCGHVNAQWQIQGNVSSVDGEKLQGASVSVMGAFKGVTTNRNGDFSINNLPSGMLKLLVSYVGYKTDTVESVVNNDVFVQIQLQPSPYLAEEIVIRSTRLDDAYKHASVKVHKEELKKIEMGQDIPVLLNNTPSMITTSDAGNGTGYTYFRIRGSDANRINVTMNGIPINDAESHGVWWVNMPDFIQSVDNIQIQRGVGTSTNGSGAFGASINFQTQTLRTEPYAEMSSAYGSFNTNRNTFSAGTGLIKNKFAFDTRISNIQSDGFIDRAHSNLASVYLSAGYFSEKTIVKFNMLTGHENTYQAWMGIPSVKLNNDTAGMNNYFNSQAYYGYIQGSSQDSAYIINSDPYKFNLYNYKNQVDNYNQNHYHFHFSHAFNKIVSLNLAAHLTRGKGYYEEARWRHSFSKYGLNNFKSPDSTTFESDYIDGDSVTKTDVIRRLWLRNYFYGLVYSLNIRNSFIHSTWGGAVNNYNGLHHGNLLWSKYNHAMPKDYEWYNGTGNKTDASSYLRFSNAPNQLLNAYIDLQVRYIDYAISGTDKDRRNITQDHTFLFFNPKAGVFYNFMQGNQCYLTMGIANREPNRSNYVDADPNKPAPVNETLYNVETGYSYSGNSFAYQLNLYYMHYKNQLVLTGEINDVGAPMMTNAKKSYRVGIEQVAEWKINKKWKLDANITLSENKILDFTEYVDNWNYWDDPMTQPLQMITQYEKTDIAFSPAIISGAQINYMPINPLELVWQHKLVGTQYLDNTASSDRMLPSYYVSNLVMQYKLSNRLWKDVRFTFMINNLLNKNYISNAWVYRYYYSGAYGKEDGMFPQAGIHFMVGIQVKL